MLTNSASSFNTSHKLQQQIIQDDEHHLASTWIPQHKASHPTLIYIGDHLLWTSKLNYAKVPMLEKQLAKEPAETNRLLPLENPIEKKTGKLQTSCYSSNSTSWNSMSLNPIVCSPVETKQTMSVSFTMNINLFPLVSSWDVKSAITPRSKLTTSLSLDWIFAEETMSGCLWRKAPSSWVGK